MRAKLKNPLVFISPVRICIHNLPVTLTDKSLKSICLKATKSKSDGMPARLTEVRLSIGQGLSGQGLFTRTILLCNCQQSLVNLFRALRAVVATTCLPKRQASYCFHCRAHLGSLSDDVTMILTLFSRINELFAVNPGKISVSHFITQQSFSHQLHDPEIRSLIFNAYFYLLILIFGVFAFFWFVVPHNA